MDPRDAARALVRWYGANARDLPWRRRHDPYEVLLVEFIMQQTRVDVGTRYYERFVQRYPTIHHLAAASEEEVLAMWSGLGYYSRAKRLHATARRIVTEFAGRVPMDPETLETLPGIGPYTAGAIASIAYDVPVPAIDGNQARVLGRLLGNRGVETASGRRRIETYAKRLLAHASPRFVNQAIMDLGSTVCLPRVPSCHICPFASACPTRSRLRDPDGEKTSRRPAEDWEALVHVKQGRVWFIEPRGTGLLGSLWNPPLRPARHEVRSPHTVQRFSHKTWRIRFIRTRSTPKGPGRWIAPSDLPGLPHGALTLKTLNFALTR